MRRAAKTDDNHKQIVLGLRKVGASVLDIHTLPNCFDILVGYKGVTYLMEIKDGNKPPSKRKLSPGEIKFMDNWKGSKYHIVLDLDQAINIITNNIN